jgi:hypothetical protein
MQRSDEHYLKEKNVWNLCEYDTNKLAVTTWNDANVHLLDRNDSRTLAKPPIISDPDKKNVNCTDLFPLPNYHPFESPFFIKRGKNSI